MHETDNKPESLYQLLLALQSADNSCENLDLSAQIDLMDGAKIKVDNYKYILDKLESHEFYLSQREKEYTAAKKTIQANIKRLREQLLFALQANGFERFTGNQYVVTQQKAKASVSLKLGEPDVFKALTYGDFVRTEYVWDKAAISKALAEDNPQAREIAELKQTIFPKFLINKEAK